MQSGWEGGGLTQTTYCPTVAHGLASFWHIFTAGDTDKTAEAGGPIIEISKVGSKKCQGKSGGGREWNVMGVYSGRECGQGSSQGESDIGTMA